MLSVLLLAVTPGLPIIHGGPSAVRAQQTDQTASSVKSSIHGRVLEEGRQRALARAAVSLRPTALAAVSDELGRFQFAGLAAGLYELHVELIGYGSRVDTVRVDGLHTIDVALTLSPMPIPLSPISVEIRLPELGRLGFYDRKEQAAGGYYITAADVSRRHPILTSDMLATVPRVDVVSIEMGRKTVLFTRGYRCRPDLFVDGIRNDGDADVDRVNPAEVAGIGIYVGLTAPVQYRRNPCGALLLWTKRDA